MSSSRALREPTRRRSQGGTFARGTPRARDQRAGRGKKPGSGERYDVQADIIGLSLCAGRLWDRREFSDLPQGPADREGQIDGSFVRDIVTNPRSEATVRGTVELARGFSMDTVAEFVESEAIAAKVRSLGVDYAQGYASDTLNRSTRSLQSLAHDESGCIACFWRCRSRRFSRGVEVRTCTYAARKGLFERSE